MGTTVHADRDDILDDRWLNRIRLEARWIIKAAVLTWGATIALLAMVLGILVVQEAPDTTDATSQVAEAFGRHDGAVWSVAFARSGRSIASTSIDGSARVWDPVSGWIVTTIPLGPGMGRSLAISPDGKFVAVGGGGTVVAIHDVETGERQWTIDTHDRAANSLAFSPDGRTLAVTGGSGGTVELWDTVTRGLRQRLSHAGSLPKRLAFAPDGRALAAADDGGRVSVWDVGDGRLRTHFAAHNEAIIALAYSADGHVLATGASLDPVARLWDAETGRALAALNGHSAGLTSLAFAPAGNMLATAGGDGAIILWETDGPRRVGTLRGHSGWVLSVAFAPDGMSLVSGGADSAVRIWRVTDSLGAGAVAHAGN